MLYQTDRRMRPAPTLVTSRVCFEGGFTPPLPRPAGSFYLRVRRRRWEHRLSVVDPGPPSRIEFPSAMFLITNNIFLASGLLCVFFMFLATGIVTGKCQIDRNKSVLGSRKILFEYEDCKSTSV